MGDFQAGISLDEAAALAGVHRNTVVRWIQIGAKGVKLRAWKVGVRWRTSPEALSEFQAACTPQAQQPIMPTNRQRRAEYEAAVERMKKRGFIPRSERLAKPNNERE